MNIFVASLPFQLEEEDVRQSFEEFGEVSSVKLILDKETGKKRGYGFVEMPDDEQGQLAIDKLNGAEFLGRAISVSKAEAREDNRSKGGFNRSRPGGGGGGYNREGGFNGNRSGGGGYNRGEGGGGYNRSNNNRQANSRDNDRGGDNGNRRWS